MTEITHHLPENLIIAYAACRLGHAFSVAVAAHVSLCMECRARLAAHEHAGGAVLEALPKETVSHELKLRTMAELSAPARVGLPPPEHAGIYPGAVMAALKGRPPRWRALGAGIRQCILTEDLEGSLRLLHIPPAQGVPDHGHGGLELTLVLQGSFSDETGRFGAGDIQVATEDMAHSPIAGGGMPCVCLAATDAPLNFRGWLPRMLQPIFRI